MSAYVKVKVVHMILFPEPLFMICNIVQNQNLTPCLDLPFLQHLFPSDAAVFAGRSIRLSATATQPILYKANHLKTFRSSL